MGGPSYCPLTGYTTEVCITSTIRRQMAKPNIIAGVKSGLVQSSLLLGDKESLLSQAAIQ